jgi:hypothetical protein
MQIEQGETYCSNCGYSLVTVKRSLRWGPICLGAFIGLLLMFIFTLALVLAAPDIIDTGWIISVAVIALICYMFAGLVAGAMAGYRGAMHGILAALVAWVLNIIVNYLLTLA